MRFKDGGISRLGGVKGVWEESGTGILGLVSRVVM